MICNLRFEAMYLPGGIPGGIQLNKMRSLTAFRRTAYIFLVEMIGFEPTTSCVQGRRSPTELHPRDVWWAEEDSNLRPHGYQPCALAT